MNQEHTAASRELLLFLKTPFVPLPARTTPVDFDASVVGQISVQAREVLKMATLQRARLAEVLADNKLDVRNLIKAVDAYLPSLWQLTASLQAQQSTALTLAHDRALDFKWSSPLSTTTKGALNNSAVLLFEACMVLNVRALAHRDAAKIAMESASSSSDEDFASYSRELRQGAGIFDFLANDLLARYDASASPSSPPAGAMLETNRLVMASLGALFLADAQRVAIAKAVSASSTSPSVAAKLMLGAAEKYEFAARCITQIPKASFDELIPGLLEEMGAYPAILRGCAANCLAQMYWAKGEHGKALGFAMDASHRLGIISMGKGLQSSPLQQHLLDALARQRAMEREYQNDCNLVYFVKPCEQFELQTPPGSFIIEPIAYALPTADVVSFVSKTAVVTAQTQTPPPPPPPTVQSFWSSLWAGSKQQPLPAVTVPVVVSAGQVSGARGGDLPGTGAATAASAVNDGGAAAIPTPPGMDPGVFASLPRDIQIEIANNSHSN